MLLMGTLLVYVKDSICITQSNYKHYYHSNVNYIFKYFNKEYPPTPPCSGDGVSKKPIC